MDDEPAVLAAVARDLRRHFGEGYRILRAGSGQEGLEILRDLVDGLDRGLGVGVGGEQHALGAGDDLARLHEEVGARQPGHPLVGHQQRDLVAARDEVA